MIPCKEQVSDSSTLDSRVSKSASVYLSKKNWKHGKQDETSNLQKELFEEYSHGNNFMNSSLQKAF